MRSELFREEEKSLVPTGFQTLDRLVHSYSDSVQTKFGQSQWPGGLRRGSTAARLLRSWVRIPPGTWMFVCCVGCCQVVVSATN